MKEQKFERVKGVKCLYRRSYQTSDGQWSVRFYGIVTTWEGKRISRPLGSDVKTAKEALALLLADNVKRVDFEAQKVKAEPPPERLTVGKRIPDFLKSKQEMKSYHFYRVCCAHLERLLGSVPLEEVTRAKILEFRALCEKESIRRHGKAVNGTRSAPRLSTARLRFWLVC